MRRSIRFFLFFLLVSVNVISPLHAEPANGPEDKLIRVVILSRHGVRSPTQHISTLDQWSNKTWPRWPVERGYLTERGGKLIQAQWKALKPALEGKGLLPENACPAVRDYTVIADRDQRTRETAISIFEGLAPGCHIQPQTGDHYDQLFHPSRADLAALNVKRTLADLKSRFDRLNDDPVAVAALKRIQEISDCCGQSLCAKTIHENSCSLTELPSRTTIERRTNKPEINGKWSIASDMAEIMLLEYGQWPGKNAGWGQVDETVLSQIVPLHDKVFDAKNRTPSLARAGGRHLLKMIEQMLLSDHSSRFNVLVGHDTNIANIGGMLDINWLVPEQGVNPIPPGSFLSFELWQKADGTREVHINFNAPTFQSLHASPAPVVKPVTVPVDRSVFPAAAFSEKVRQLVSR